MHNMQTIFDKVKQPVGKPKNVEYKCTDCVTVMRAPEGTYSIYGYTERISKDGESYLQFLRLSKEHYWTKEQAEEQMLKGTYTLNPDYKSFYISQMIDEYLFSDYIIFQDDEGKYVIGVTEMDYVEEATGEMDISRFIPLSKETFSNMNEAKGKLMNGDWTLLFNFNIDVRYNPEHRLQVMRTVDGTYLLVRNTVKEDEISGELETGYLEMIILDSKTKEEANLELETYLGRV